MIVISCFKYLVRVWNLVDNILLDLMWSLSLSVDIALSNEACLWVLNVLLSQQALCVCGLFGLHLQLDSA